MKQIYGIYTKNRYANKDPDLKLSQQLQGPANNAFRAICTPAMRAGSNHHITFTHSIML